MQSKLLYSALVALSLPLSVFAAQYCGKQRIPDSARSCPDGGIPMFVADEVRPAAPAQDVRPAETPRSTASAAETAKPDYYYGIWRTRIPGAVWTSPSGYHGYDWLHVSAGVSVGDLIIKPDGTYVWNSYGGKSGKWVRGTAEYPIVLIDTVEKREWRIGADPKRTGGRDIIVWDGKHYWYDGRR